jgi:hypothetical protein
LNVEPPILPREALADVCLRAPTRGNRRLESLLEAVNEDDQIKAWCTCPPSMPPVGWACRITGSSVGL